MKVLVARTRSLLERLRSTVEVPLASPQRSCVAEGELMARVFVNDRNIKWCSACQMNGTHRRQDHDRYYALAKRKIASTSLGRIR